MPAKKSAPQKAQPASTGMGDVWKWIYVIGLIVAGLAGLLGSTIGAVQPYLGYLLLLAAILSGIFFLDSGDVMHYGIRVLVLFAVQKGFDMIPAIGSYLSGFFGGVYGFVVPAALTLLVVYFIRKYFSNAV